MRSILGIDLGTTNSAVSMIQDGKPTVLRDDIGEIVMPSVVGLNRDGKVLVGQEARNQAILAPERTVRSVKREMGGDSKIPMGEETFAPQEISSMILRVLKDRASKALGRVVDEAVITVPAFFSENQREATREAGELAGLNVVRIINEPTAASLMYEPLSEGIERLLVYDLGGGTFDVSVVQIEQGVVEVLASHGDTHLGGDDFDQLLFDHVCDAFHRENDLDPRDIPTAKSRLIQAVEEAKKKLSSNAFTTITEEFIAEKAGKPLHLKMEIDRLEYEGMIEPLLKKTLTSVDAALEDAKLTATQLDRIILVGGSTRTPLVHRLLQEQLHHDLHSEIDPDLCVSLGAAVQGGLIAGIDVGPVLVDITPHTLGIECVGTVHGVISDTSFAPIITRNTPLPASRSEIYYTAYDGQKAAQIMALQGENEDARFNKEVGDFKLDGLNEEANGGNEIVVQFDLDLDGILTISAVERATGLRKELRIDNAVTQFREKTHQKAKSKIAAMFADSAEQEPGAETADVVTTEGNSGDSESDKLIDTVCRLIPQASKEDAEEMQALVDELRRAVASDDTDHVERIRNQLDELVFYLEDA